MRRLFRVGFNRHNLVGDIISKDSGTRVLVLHGGGKSNRAAFRILRKEIFGEGISSCAFDFIGHGDTGGALIGSSLGHRTQQVCAIVASQRMPPPLSVIAASMGAYTAVKLLEHYPIATLILLVPAMYAAEAYHVPFGPQFSEIIRRPQSWQRSDAWDLLATYTGRLLIVAAEKDKIIPTGVIQKIYASASRAKERRLYVAPQATHFVFTDLRSNDPHEFERLLALIVETLRADTI
ncbi:MAG: alpha/beta fold hydrolase [Desulfobacterales bacterium]|nr:MAG: alpha/beta fold hydrolase [Desulfobacterales bacterium]